MQDVPFYTPSSCVLEITWDLIYSAHFDRVIKIMTV